MKQIPISNTDSFALVDDEDYKYLSEYKWFNMAGYAVRQKYKIGSGKANRKVQTIRMHRWIMGFPEGKEIDHIDGNRLNNQKTNLRICSRNQNAFNSKTRSDNTSGFKGVIWSNQKNGWSVIVQKNRKVHYGGTFKDITDAMGAAYGLRLLLHKEFTRD